MSYSLLVKTYDKSPDKHDIPVMQRETWAELIDYALGASMIAELTWSRVGGVEGLIHHMDFYADHFAEGVIILANSERIKTYV